MNQQQVIKPIRAVRYASLGCKQSFPRKLSRHSACVSLIEQYRIVSIIGCQLRLVHDFLVDLSIIAVGNPVNDSRKATLKTMGATSLRCCDKQEQQRHAAQGEIWAKTTANNNLYPTAA